MFSIIKTQAVIFHIEHDTILYVVQYRIQDSSPVIKQNTANVFSLYELYTRVTHAALMLKFISSLLSAEFSILALRRVFPAEFPDIEA